MSRGLPGSSPQCSIPGCTDTSAAKGYCKRHYMANWKYGNPLDIREKGMIGKKHRPETRAKMSKTARRRIQQGVADNLFLPGHTQSRGEKSAVWKGNDAGYQAIHVWVNRRITKKSCEHCGSLENLDTANKSGKYLRNLADWMVLCRSCHMKHDRRKGIWKHPRFA